MKTVTGTVEVTVKDAQGKEKKEIGPVTYSFFETSEDVITWLDDSVGEPREFTLADGKTTVKLAPKTADILEWANYGANLKARATVRNEIQARLEGPEKAINRQIQDFVKARAAAGKPVTEEQARKMVLALMEMEAEVPASA